MYVENVKVNDDRAENYKINFKGQRTMYLLNVLRCLSKVPIVISLFVWDICLQIWMLNIKSSMNTYNQGINIFVLN